MAQSGEEFASEVARLAAGRAKSRSVQPLRRLVPFLVPYRWQIMGAGLALVVSSAATLVVPVAARRMIDFGFIAGNPGLIGKYFLALIGVAAVLGIATGLRYYFVTWLGERVIADIRKAVFSHVLSLTPAFFEVTRTGEVLSRLTADTTLIQTVIGSSASIALRNLVMLIGALIMVFVTSLKLSVLVLAVVPVVVLPLILIGRWIRVLSRKSQDTIADTSAHASETLNAVQTVQSFTHEEADRRYFARAVENAFNVAIWRTAVRAGLTAAVIFAAFACVVGILWVGASDVAAHTMTGGELV
jgi:ATP-binding cassette, subfamily B, bacterial